MIESNGSLHPDHVSNLGMLHWMQLGQTISSLYVLHYVGPSAGYYGCLSRTILACKIHHNMAMFWGLIGVLSMRAMVSFLQMPDSQISLSADIVHLIAVIVGVFLQVSYQRTQRRYSEQTDLTLL